MCKIIQLKEIKPSNVKHFIDCDKGWKFTEEDKGFLIEYYNNYLKCLNEEYGGDFSEDIEKILDSIIQYGVLASKDLIQEDALLATEAFGYDIYEKYSDSPDILKVIENSVLNICW